MMLQRFIWMIPVEDYVFWILVSHFFYLVTFSQYSDSSIGMHSSIKYVPCVFNLLSFLKEKKVDV
jgi:hypothetical protein